MISLAKISSLKSVLLLRGRNQRAGLEQAAEFFFSGDAMFAFAGLESVGSQIAHFESFEPDDADKHLADFPDLTLSKF